MNTPTPLRFLTGAPDDRPSFPDLMMTVAHLMATRSTCLRARTGAVLCDPEWAVLTTGYNGAPAHQPHCRDSSCLVEGGHCVRTVHAEMNALLQAARVGVSVRGAYLLVTHRPCVRCATALVRAGVARVWYAAPYDTDGSVDQVEELFRGACVSLSQVDYDPVVPLPQN